MGDFYICNKKKGLKKVLLFKVKEQVLYIYITYFFIYYFYSKKRVIKYTLLIFGDESF